MKTATFTLEHAASGYAAEPRDRFSQYMAAARQTLNTWRERARTRRALGELSLEQLDDIGIEPGDAMREANKPFWRA